MTEIELQEEIRDLIALASTFRGAKRGVTINNTEAIATAIALVKNTKAVDEMVSVQKEILEELKNLNNKSTNSTTATAKKTTARKTEIKE